MFRLFVPGIPKPQGSKSAFKRGNRIVLVEASKSLPEWRNTLEWTITAYTQENRFTTVLRPFSIELHFWLPRAKTNAKPFHTQKPDLDKLIRAVLDALTKAKAIKDDSYCVELSARKSWDDFHPAGVEITMIPFDNEQITAGMSELHRKRKLLL
jgi:crossover junction endodeoxyribonuclease RusA